ncbi:MAG: biotin carboxylase N-terminal domain-containing protein, partial [Bacteroidota bacterium]
MEKTVQRFRKILVANRGEIAVRVLRAISELNIKTVAIYSYEDRYSPHRYKADEAYQIGAADNPLKPYLDIDAIIDLAKSKQVDAIHPGYGFLSENVHFVRKCAEAGIVFIGPRPEVMERLGDKVQAKKVAREVKVPLIPDSKVELKELVQVVSEANRIGFPVMLKAAAGGGGR